MDWNIIGIIGGIVGSTTGGLAVWDRWKHRRPKLRLRIPSAFINHEPGQVMLCTLLRISNDRRAVATIYLETIKAYVRTNNEWHAVEVKTMSLAGKPGARTPLMDDNMAWLSGIEEVPGLNRFTDNIVEFDHPLTGYLALLSSDKNLFNSADAVKFVLEDCHSKTLKLQAAIPDMISIS